MFAMPYRDFDVTGLARYLHLTPQQVMKLAERGKLPGRKVSGEWRFAKPDIHHWFEHRIGLSGESELLKVEAMLEQAAPAESQPEICLAEMLPREAIAVPLLARMRNSVIDAMAALAARTGMLWDVKAMAEAVKAREDMHTTALENGVVLLHPPADAQDSQPAAAGLGLHDQRDPLWRSRPVDRRLFLDLLPGGSGPFTGVGPAQPHSHLGRLSGALHQARNAEEAHRAIVDAEARLR